MKTSTSIKVADEVWVATALLHREQPQKAGFSVAEIVDRASLEKLSERIRPGLSVHAYQHCVANRRPNPGNHRMLYALPNGERRLFHTGDDYHFYREGGKTAPNPSDLPAEYSNLVEWYQLEYDRAVSAPTPEASEIKATTESIWDRIGQIWEEVPIEERLKIPSDGAAHHDRYIRANR